MPRFLLLLLAFSIASPTLAEEKGSTPAADPPATEPTPTTTTELVLGTKGKLLLDETFPGDKLPEGWSLKAGRLGVVDGVLRASQDKSAGSLGLFSRVQPHQDAAIQVDFRFDGGSGLNVSVNPEAGQIRKRGHLYSVMITPRMWNITEHNDKSDPASKSEALASAQASFETGKWYTLVIENKGADVVARIDGFPPLRAKSDDFRVRKPGIEFRVLGRNNGEISFDNLKVWELQ